MGRPGLTRHRKFKRAARALDRLQPGFGDILARGALELLWDAAYENGDEFLGDAADVEGVAGWRGEEGVLVDALAGAGGDGQPGFIEEGGSPSWPAGTPGTFRVHDLWDHAPTYVQKRAEREAERVAKGKTLSDVRRDAANVRWKKQAAATGMQPSSICNANGATPAPAPAPALTSSLRSEAAPSAGAPAPASPVVASLPCVGKGSQEYGVTEAQIASWGEAFPGIDVLGEVRKARAWLEANPTKRKTHRGCPAFLVRWLSRAQDQGQRAGPADGAERRRMGVVATASQPDARDPGWASLEARLPPGALSGMCLATLAGCELHTEGRELVAVPRGAEVAAALETYRARLEQEAAALGFELRILEPTARAAAGGVR